MSRPNGETPSLTTVGHAFRTIVWPRRRIVFLGLVLILLNRGAGLVLPTSSKFLVDRAILPGNADLLRWILVAVAAAIAVQSVTSYLLTRLLSVEAQRLISELRAQVQRHVLHLPVRFFEDRKSGELVSRIMNDVEGVRNLVGTGLVQLVGGSITALAAFVLLLRIHVLLTLCVIAPLVALGLVTLKAFGYIRPIFRERGQIQAEVTGRLTESLAGVRVVKGFAAESFEAGVFEEGVLRLFQNVKSSLTASSLVTSSATLLLGLASVGIMGYGGTLIMRGEMTIGDFFAFFLYLGFLIAPILQMSNIGSQMTEAFAGLDRTEELLRTVREEDDPERTVTLETVRGDLALEEVDFEYDAGKPILRDISFEAPAGTMTALVGSSGSGKSTIAGLAASFLTPNGGRVRIDGQDLAKVRLDSFRRHLGLVLQDEFLFDGTIRDNLLFARPDASGEELREAMRVAHVDEFVDRLEAGLETVIGERGVKLSGGQRQRVAIARALLADPRVLILDEATSNLDAESELLIQESLQKLMEGRTTLVIAHRLSTIRRADQILVVENGRIAERGTHAELLATEGRYYQLHTYQARI